MFVKIKLENEVDGKVRSLRITRIYKANDVSENWRHAKN